MLKFFLKTDNSPAQLLIRLALGAVIFPHGAQKALGWFGGAGFLKTLEVFSGMGFPLWATVILIFCESVGSLFLILGLLTRLWALCIGTAITICMFTVHLDHGFFMNWLGQQKGEGFEFHILVIGIALALVIRGGGALSLDRVLAAKGRKRVFAP